jgi:nitroreductase
MDCMEVILKRRSVRSFLTDSVPEEILTELLEAARVAPSGGNGQSWCFGVVKDRFIKEELAKAAGEQMWIAEAPVVIACCAKLDDDRAQAPEDDFGLIVDKTRFGGELMAYLNKCPDRKAVNTFWCNAVPLIPGEHMFLSAVNYGLSACWVGYLDINKASEILRLPEDMVCLFLLPIGYAKEEPGEIERKALDEIVFYERFDK